MRTLRSMVAAAVVFFLTSPAWAGPGADQVGAYFDGQGTQSALNASPFVSFDFYAVAHPASDIAGFQLHIGADPGITVLGAVGPPVLCVGPGCGPLDWSMGLASCTAAGVLALVRVTGMMFAPATDQAVCVGPLGPPDWAVGTLDYWTCAEEIVPLGLAQNPVRFDLPGCGIVNPTVISTAAATWGGVKTRF